MEILSLVLCQCCSIMLHLHHFLLHLDKNRCRTETSTARISLSYDTRFQQKKSFYSLKALSEECRRRTCVSEGHCCPCGGLFWGLHYFCGMQHSLFSLLCRLNCFEIKVGDPLEKASCFGVSFFLSTIKVITSQLQVLQNILKWMFWKQSGE